MKKNHFKKLTVFLAIFVLVSSLLAGCGSTSATEGSKTTISETTAKLETTAQAVQEKKPEDYKGTVSMWTWDKTNEDNMVAEFNKVYPNIKMDIVAVGYNDYANKLQTSVAGGIELSDIICAEIGFRKKVMDMDLLENLEEAPYNLDRKLVLDSVLPLISNNGQIVGGDQTICAGGLAYKAPLAKQYLGTDDPAELEKMLPTWEAFIEKGKEVQQKSNGKVFILSSPRDVQQYFDSSGTEAFTENDKVTQFTLDTNATRRFTLLKAMVDAKTFDKSISDHYTPAWNESFKIDNQIFYLAATWSPAFVIKPNDKDSTGRWRIMNAPGGPFSLGGTIYGIWKDSKNKDNAWQYIKWLSFSEAGGESMAKVRGYYIPYKPFIDKHDFSKDIDPYFGTQNIAEKFIKEMAPQMKIRALEKYSTQITQAYTAVETAMLNDKSNGMTLEQYKELLTKEIKDRCPDLQW